MALPTAPQAPPAPQQAHTPGMGTHAAAPHATAAPALLLDPVLAADIDPVILHRLFPQADSIADAGAAALAQGRKTMTAGLDLKAAQQVAEKMP